MVYTILVHVSGVWICRFCFQVGIDANADTILADRFSMPVWVGAGDDVEQEGDKDSGGDIERCSFKGDGLIPQGGGKRIAPENISRV